MDKENKTRGSTVKRNVETQEISKSNYEKKKKTFKK